MDGSDHAATFFLSLAILRNSFFVFYTRGRDGQDTHSRDISEVGPTCFFAIKLREMVRFWSNFLFTASLLTALYEPSISRDGRFG